MNYTHTIKPLLDFFLTIIGSIFLLPILFVIGIISWIYHKENPFFVQKRLGKDGKIFNIFKLKTMNNARDRDGNLLSDEERLTDFGKWLRKTSLDEIPQIFNVWKGEMSWVGPRPLLPNYMELYNDFQKRRNEVKPGITGWAQINGRNSITWEQKFEYDVWYVDNVSLWLDIKILFLTLIKVFTSEGINEEGQATSQEFQGNKK